ncbi:hypothetical protein L7Q18_32845 [Achromobacter xylosoxidans]|nr:hypothetical protein [Achromobacter xylosoxidans]
MEGTYRLPEAQRDRFMARITMGYPTRSAELAMLEHHGATSPLDEVRQLPTLRRSEGSFRPYLECT